MIQKQTKKQVIQKEILTILKILKRSHGKTMLEQLKHFTPFQITVATLLSSRTKDATTIPIVIDLFKKYPKSSDIMKVSIKDLKERFYGIGFYKVKARHVKELAKISNEKYKGSVPSTLQGLTSLPGVGEKTANCVLAYSFKIPAIAVDTHVHRIVNQERLAWINTKTTKDTEAALKQLVPKKHWIDINKLLVDHGQRICAPIRPKCSECTITKYCKFKDKRLK